MSAEQIVMAFAEGIKQALRESQAESRAATEIMAREMARQSAEITQALTTITRPQPNIHIQLPKFNWFAELEIKFATLGIGADLDKISSATTALKGVAQQLIVQANPNSWELAKKG